MSIERCHRHDESYDTDFTECCPRCERSPDFDADVAAFEATLEALPSVNDTPHHDAIRLLDKMQGAVMSALKTSVESYLQDTGDECADVLADLNMGTLHITDDNTSDWERALVLLMKAYDAVHDLKRHTYPTEHLEHDDATQPVWRRIVSAA